MPELPSVSEHATSFSGLVCYIHGVGCQKSDPVECFSLADERVVGGVLVAVWVRR